MYKGNKAITCPRFTYNNKTLSTSFACSLAEYMSKIINEQLIIACC